MNKSVIEIQDTKTREEIDNIRALNYFLESQEKKSPIVMRVEGCQSHPNAKTPELKWLAVGYVNGWKVLIPGGRMGFSNIDNDDTINKENKEKAYKKYISEMIGADIEFMVHPNPQSIGQGLKMVIGDRKMALDKRMDSNYFKKDKNGLSRMERAFEAGKPVQARVVTVARSVVWVEIFGYITQVYARDVSWRYVNRLQDVIHVGDVVKVKFLDLKVDKENKTVTSEVSIKAAHPNVMKENMKKYQQGSLYRGIVTGAKDGYFIQVGSVESGIDVYCKKVNCPDEPKIGDTVVVNLYIFDEEAGRVYGSIERVIERRESWTIA